MDRIAAIWEPDRQSGSLDASIVVPAYNEQLRIQQTIVALARSVFGTTQNIELIVVDNASTDDTAGRAERLGARVVHEPRKGLSYARQAGLEHAAGPVILSTDADTDVGPEWSEGHLRHYANTRVVGVVGTNDFDGAHWTYRIHQFGADVVHRTARTFGVGPRSHWSGCNTSYRTAAAKDVGGYELGSDLGEDRIIVERLEQAGTVRYDPSEKIRVITSGRRFDTAPKVFAHIAAKVGRLLTGTLYGSVESSRTFDDIR